MPFFLSAIGNEQQFNASGSPLSGGKINTYAAGTTTRVATYTDKAGATEHANPIILNTLGLPANPIWLKGGVSYKFVITDSTDVVQRTVDDITGTNDPAVASSVDQWVLFTAVPTFISATSFSLAGDQTNTFQVGRRVKSANTGGAGYHTITASTFAASITTVTVTNDSVVLDAGLSAVSYGLLSVISPSVPAIYARTDALTIYTTAGTSTAYTLTPSPAITAYAAGQSFFVTFNAASGAAPTLAISGLATPPNLVKENADGTYSNIAAGDIPINHRSRVTLISTTQALVERMAAPRVVAWAYLTMQGTSSPTLTAGFNVASVVRAGVGQYTVNFINPLASVNYSSTVTTSQLGVATLNGGNLVGSTGIGLYNSNTQAYIDGAGGAVTAIQIVM